jgi:hypothetical protein
MFLELWLILFGLTAIVRHLEYAALRKQAKSCGHIGGFHTSAALSPGAAEFVRHHPGEARVIITAASEAVAAQFEAALVDTPSSLRAFMVSMDLRPVLIGVYEAVRRLRVSRATAYNWIESHRLLGWRLTRGNTDPFGTDPWAR